MLRGHAQTTYPVEGGGGVSQMSTLYYNSYLIKVATKGEGGQKLKKVATWFVYDSRHV